MNHGKIKKTTSKNQIERPQMRGVLFVGRSVGRVSVFATPDRLGCGEPEIVCSLRADIAPQKPSVASE